MKRLHHFILLAGCALLLVSCNDRAPSAASSRIVAGVDFTALFAPPRQSEIEAVQRDWDSRKPTAQNFAEVARATTYLGAATATVRAVSHTVDGLRHYGLIIAPSGAAERSLPVLLYAHGGESGISVPEVLYIATVMNGANAGRFVYVAPSFRSETLDFYSQEFVSDGPPSPWDRDVDDALALLEAALANTPAADPNRLGVLGVSRGACVAMLLAVRDPRLRLVVEYFGPTDFFGTFVQQVTEEILLGNPRDLPGLNYLTETLLRPLQAGSLTLAQARLELLRRSPVYFAHRLPPLQLHHGTADPIVPVSEGERLREVLQGLARPAADFEFHFYPGGQHHPASLPGCPERTQNFLARLLAGGG
ncbi:MAG: alpha/beta fold hydrolase [candidate division KSB1 bacterium]|nr:alpha/beta fold hydrolase [candidate division KSB1 bacterium]MDZ7273435.1 alpha/beta fold hydrolase [candidate division KSB1 bacterium]MDZ7286973.1 alpha/beta fold hydrolase [candidate division KSB1 bacterium]MDZ7299674.1 alpha/beta fold hydrolase [candidate division KSB1 bacterium]MDZ7307938.1 alpha/beta fold hydrolase [candidate division KSB1 bacterium]